MRQLYGVVPLPHPLHFQAHLKAPQVRVAVAYLFHLDTKIQILGIVMTSYLERVQLQAQALVLHSRHRQIAGVQAPRRVSQVAHRHLAPPHRVRVCPHRAYRVQVALLLLATYRQTMTSLERTVIHLMFKDG